MSKINLKALFIGLTIWSIFLFLALSYFFNPTADEGRKFGFMLFVIVLGYPFIIQPLRGKNISSILNQNLSEKTIGYNKKDPSNFTQYALIIFVLISIAIGILLYYIFGGNNLNNFEDFTLYPVGIGFILYGLYTILTRKALHNFIWFRGIPAIVLGILSIIFGISLLFYFS